MGVGVRRSLSVKRLSGATAVRPAGVTSSKDAQAAAAKTKLAFKIQFAYNTVMASRPSPKHPADAWQQASLKAGLDKLTALRLAAISGHLRQDLVSARRVAIVELLSDGRPHPREEICREIGQRLGRRCWGKRPAETLVRDLRVLRRGGLRIAFSRWPGLEGYYLQYPALRKPSPSYRENINWDQIKAIRKMSVAEKNRSAFQAAEFALRQKRLILAEEHPDWSEAQIDAEARRLIYGRHQVKPT